MAVAIESTCEKLPASWAAICREKQTTVFAWAHDGQRANKDWVQLNPDGVLKTKWGDGTWECQEGAPDILDLCFGPSRHVCRLQGDNQKFIVEKRIRLRGANAGEAAPIPKLKGVEVTSAGWPLAKAQEAPPSVTRKRKEELSPEQAVKAKMKAALIAEEKLAEAEKVAVETAAAAAAAAEAADRAAKLAKAAESKQLKMAEVATKRRREAEEVSAQLKKVGLGRFAITTPKRVKSSCEPIERSPSPNKVDKISEETSLACKKGAAGVEGEDSAEDIH